MVASPIMERRARELLNQERDRLREGSVWGGEDSLESGPPAGLLRELLQLLAEMHDRPVHELRPMIRRLVHEHRFVDSPGDACVEAGAARRIERQVELLVRVLEGVRQAAMESGEWSATPAAPLMCG